MKKNVIVMIVSLIIGHNAIVLPSPAMAPETPLHAAIKANSMETATRLIENGANLKTVDGPGFTPLARAVAEGKTDMVKLLVALSEAEREAGDCEAEVYDNNDYTSLLTIAVYFQRAEIAAFLIEHGAKVTTPDSFWTKKPLLHLAIDRCNPAMVKLLCEHGAPSDEIYEFLTPIERAMAIKSNPLSKKERLVLQSIIDFLGSKSTRSAESF